MFLEFFCGRLEEETLLGGGDSELGCIGVEVVVVLIWVLVQLKSETRGRVENERHVQGGCNYRGRVGKR